MFFHTFPSIDEIHFFHHFSSWFLQFRGCSVMDRLQSAQSPCDTSAAAIRRPATGRARRRKSGVSEEALHSQSGKYNRTGAKTLCQSAPGVTGQRQGVIIIIIILLRPGPELLWGTELKQNQQRTETHYRDILFNYTFNLTECSVQKPTAHAQLDAARKPRLKLPEKVSRKRLFSR